MIRNLDPGVYRILKARAAAEGRPIGEVVTDAIRAYVGRPAKKTGRRAAKKSIADLPVFDGGPGSEHWSEEVDEFLYGGKG